MIKYFISTNYPPMLVKVNTDDWHVEWRFTGPMIDELIEKVDELERVLVDYVPEETGVEE